MENTRKIIHIDMDAFYASIEQRDNPHYRGRPLAVGHDGGRGVVAAASYEARKYGVRSAMPSLTARARCPGLIFVPARFDVYKDVSSTVMEIFHGYTDLVEPLSLDEAFLDVTQDKHGIRSATLIAKRIKEDILRATELTASAGVSFNKLLAKIASDYRKPDGLFVITPEMADGFTASLPVETFYGVGKVTTEKMHSLGIKTGADLRRFTREQLVDAFGKAGHSYYNYARAIDRREVNPERIRKSLGAEDTFSYDVTSLDELVGETTRICITVWERMSRRGYTGRTVTLKIKYFDFRIATRSHTSASEISTCEELTYRAVALLRANFSPGDRIRLLGVTVSNSLSFSVREDGQLLLPF